MKRFRITAFVLPLLLAGAGAAEGAGANLEYIQDYEAAFLATCTRAHRAEECQRAMERLQRILGLDEFVVLVGNARLLEVVSAAK
jgi:hypothetical protein